MATQLSTVGIAHAHLLVWRVLLLLRAMGVGVMAGIVAGFVAGGIGSRLAMKVVAIVAGPAARGRITENGNAIGVFTTDTTFLLFFGAAIGTLGGLLYIALRPWLPAAGRWRGLAFGAVLLATGGSLIIEDANFDFTRFGRPALNVALFAALYLGFGLLVAPLADWLDRRLPTLPAERASRLGPGGILGSAALAALPAILVLGIAFGIGSGGIALAVPLLAIAALVGLGARSFPAGSPRRLPRLGGYLLATSGGLVGFLPLVVLASGLVLNRDEQPATRLVAALPLLLIAGGLVGRFWLARDDRREGKRLTTLLLAVPVLVGLGLTLREIGLILFGL